MVIEMTTTKNKLDSQFMKEVFNPFFKERFGREANPEESYCQEWIQRVSSGTWIYFADKETFNILINHIMNRRGN